ncbi:MAG: molecular chaperone HscC [Leptospirales bacterium]|nr:molecular chaperone HscC [Leptospirales bacterium]
MMIGIDLGTTNSLAAAFRNGRSELIPNALGENITPSVVSLSEDGAVLVGKAARDRLVSHPQSSAANFKRYMGSPRTQRLGNRDYRPEELSALVLRSLKEDAERFVGEKVEEAIITVPAYFRDAQRRATRLAGELAGLKVDRLLNEPTAAALSFGAQEQLETRVLVFDLGGGTFDVSVLEFFEGVVEVRASAGDNMLGGEDFNEALLQRFLREHKQEPAAIQRDAALWNRLLRAAEMARRALSQEAQTVMRFEDERREWQMSIDRDVLAELCQPLLDRMRSPVERALRDARIRAAELNDIILVGGATRMPLVRDMVARMFGRFPSFSVPPDEAIALGAGVQAGLRKRDSALREVVLTDVAPYSLGIEVADVYPDRIEPGFFSPLIERNTVIPASRSSTFGTVRDNQRTLDLMVYQGESRYTRENIFLGKIEVQVPARRQGEEQVEIRFTYDPSGLLEVDATVISTGKHENLLIQESPGSLSESDIRRILEGLQKLKLHPREDMENMTVLARARRMYEETLGERRQRVGELINAFHHALETQDELEIERWRLRLNEQLDQLEENPFL